ncbi:hypothetical protein [Haliangium sp.]|uniref:hypothetical protein n=1 Tax=Haliangium sp. TaxID=2663208 RepID=UPI003D0F999F
MTVARARRAGMVVVLAGLVTAAVGQAQEARPRSGVIAVLPLAAADQRMRIYGAPVAKAVAQNLRKHTGRQVETPSSSELTSSAVSLVVDGRIVTEAGGWVRLEARVRDPERGETVATAGTEAAALTDIDRLAAELARALGSGIEAASARAEQARAVGAAGTERAQPGPEISSGEGEGTDPEPAPDSGADATQGRDGAARPALVVFGAVGEAAGGAVPVTDAATRSAGDLARRLGYRAVSSIEQGWVPRAVASAALGRAGATYGLVIEVRDIRFSWLGVLAARGTIRAALVDAEGRWFYDRVHETGTLVGNRGDRHSALVRFVMEQAVDIFVPDLTRAIDLHARRLRTP